MLYDALQTLYDALQCSLTVSTMLYNALQYSAMRSTMLYNALQRSNPNHQLVVENSITSGSLPETFREPSGNLSETFHSSSGDRLETFGNITGAVTAVRFYFRDASGTSSRFPSGSFRDPSGNAHFEAMI